MATTFQCSVITPERVVLECDATFVAFPAHDGEMGVLQRRAPLVCKLGIGSLRVATLEAEQLLYVDEGFAQVSGSRLTILTEQARKAEQLDAAAAEASLVEAVAMPNITDEQYDARNKAMQRATVQIKLARK
jgi:F-type H+-transporting ATPase subunit epsilon